MRRLAWLVVALPSCRLLFPTPSVGSSPDAIEVQLSRATAQVAQARERALERPAYGETNANQLQDIVRTEYLSGSPSRYASVLRYGRALGLHGDTDPVEVLLSDERIKGVWLSDEDRMYVARGMTPEASETVWQHELTHALQDRYFDIDPIGIDGWPADMRIAHRLLVEGEATYVPLIIELGAGVVDWTPLSELGVREPVAARSVEQRYLVSVVRPYVVGPAVIQRLRQQGGWAAVDARWRSPPLSTEQLLEPERATDLPRYAALDVREVLPFEWSADDADTLGQQEMFDVLWASLPQAEDRVAEAVRGWDGDRIQILARNDGRLGFVWRSVWDSPADAEAFAALVIGWRPGDRSTTVETRGDEVLVTCLEPELVPSVPDAAWMNPFSEVVSLEAILAVHGT